MPRGRRPKPSKLKDLQGNPGKRRSKRKEPQPAKGAVCPSYLNADEKKEWSRLSAILEPLGLLTSADSDALAAYCVAAVRWKDAVKNLKKAGTVVKAPSGYPMLNPYLAVANGAMKEMKALLLEFGMTPAARSKLSVEAPTEERDPFTVYEGGRKS